MRSSKRGLSIVKAEAQKELSLLEISGRSINPSSESLNKMITVDATTTTGAYQPSGFIYGWKPDHALAQISFRPDESWLIYQAQSILRKQEVSLEEAKELFMRIDITTRKPKGEKV